MAIGYSQMFTLKDIFNNNKLKAKVPLVNYKEKELENGKISRRTNAKTINRFVFDTATSAARPFYKSIKTTSIGDMMIISGEMVGDHDGAVDAVYNALQSKRVLFIWTANNVKMIRDALKESEKDKNNGIAPKLYLRVQSMQQIEGMTRQQIQALLQNIMENIVYGDDFPETQKKYGVENWNVSNKFNYNLLKLRWKNRVGA